MRGASGKMLSLQAHELKPDLILMDLLMDDMDGVKLTTEIKDLPQIKVVMLTSFIEDKRKFIVHLILE